MNPLLAFVGLLALTYFGSILMTGRSIRGFGLPSGSEYLLLGFLLGPTALGLIDEDTVSLLSPLLQVGLGWLAFLTGLNWGGEHTSKLRLPGLLSSVFLAILCGALVAGAVFGISTWLTDFSFQDRWLLAVAAGAVGTETTRFAVRWVFERHGAQGPLTQLIASFGDFDELPALLLVAFLCAVLPVPERQMLGGPWLWFGATLALGFLLALTCVALLGPTLHHGEAISFTLGSALLGTGIALQLGLAGITALFIMGWTQAALSRHRTEMRLLLNKSEQPILLPVFLLAGAHLTFNSHPALFWILLVALAARLTGKLLSGFVLYSLPPGRAAGPFVGLGLLSSGFVTIAIGLTLSLRLQNQLGDILLALAVACAFFGEAIGPLALRRSLARANELTTQAPSSAS